MPIHTRPRGHYSILILLFFLSPTLSLRAFNGLFPTAYGARQAGMGGAFTGVGGSVMDLESNPAHLGRRDFASFEMGLGLHNVLLEYDDTKSNPNPDYAYTNRIHEKPKALFPYIGYANRWNDRIGWGIAGYLQGGGGGQFRGIRRMTPRGQTVQEMSEIDLPLPGTHSRQIQEDIAFRFMNFKVTPGIGFQWGKFGIGFGLDIAFSQMQLKRETKDLTVTLLIPGGFQYQSNPALGYGGKIGFTYRLTEQILLGYNYTTKNHFHLDGKIRMDSYDPLRNRDIGVSRFMEWPDRHSLGVSYTTQNWLFALDLRFVPWAETFNRTSFVLEEPWMETPLGVDSNRFQFNLRWANRSVIAVGSEYKWSDALTLRAGYNYGATPITGTGVNPFLGATTEHHLSGGFSIHNQGRNFHFAMQHAFVGRVEGDKTSDWTISRSVLSTENIQMGQFSHSKATRAYSIYLGWEEIWR